MDLIKIEEAFKIDDPNIRKTKMMQVFVEEVVSFDQIASEIKSFYNSDVEDAKAVMGKGDQRGLQLPITFTVNWSFKTPDGIKTYKDDKGSRKTVFRARDRAEQVFSKFPNSKIWLTKWIGDQIAHEDYIVHEPEGWSEENTKITENIVNDGVIIDNGLRYSRKEQEVISQFLQFVKDNLDLEEIPNIHILDKRKDGMTYGMFNPQTEDVDVYGKNRGLADVLRTSAHEYVHYKQKIENRIPENLQHRDHELESEANTKAGDLVYMFGIEHPEIYEMGDSDENKIEVPVD